MKKIVLFAVTLFFAVSSKAQWEPEVRMTNDPFSSMTGVSTSAHAIAVSGDSVHMVWYDERDGNFEIYYKRSIDGGSTWCEDIRLTNTTLSSRFASIAVSGSLVHVAWSEYPNANSNTEIYYKCSTDGGKTWGEDTRLTYTPSWTWHPCLTVSGSFLHLVYYDFADGLWEVYYKRSVDGGLTWEPETQLTNDPAGSYWASIAASGPVLHVVWHDDRDGNSEIYYKRSTDAGLTWGTDTRLTTADSTSARGSCGVSGSDVYVVWADVRDGNKEIYFKHSSDGGLSWGEDTRLTNYSSDSDYPNLAVSGAGLYVVWVDDRDGNLEIYFKRSTDGAESWEPDVRLTDNPFWTDKAFIATSEAKVHVIWYDERDGNYEIYYKRDPTGGIPVGLDNELGNCSDQQFSIFPNPASTVIRIQFKDEKISSMNPGSEKFVLSVRNILGEIVINKQIHVDEPIVDVSTLPNGIYFVELKTRRTMVESRKLIISR